jgi:hypothetical protein
MERTRRRRDRLGRFLTFLYCKSQIKFKMQENQRNITGKTLSKKSQKISKLTHFGPI